MTVAAPAAPCYLVPGKGREKCLAAGMDGYISKPIDFQESLELIRRTLEERRTRAVAPVA